MLIGRGAHAAEKRRNLAERGRPASLLRRRFLLVAAMIRIVDFASECVADVLKRALLQHASPTHVRRAGMSRISTRARMGAGLRACALSDD